MKIARICMRRIFDDEEQNREAENIFQETWKLLGIFAHTSSSIFQEYFFLTHRVAWGAWWSWPDYLAHYYGGLGLRLGWNCKAQRSTIKTKEWVFFHVLHAGYTRPFRVEQSINSEFRVMGWDFGGWKMMEWGVGAFLFDGCWMKSTGIRFFCVWGWWVKAVFRVLYDDLIPY